MTPEVAIAGLGSFSSNSLAARMSRVLDVAIEALTSALFVATIVLALLQVYFRYVLNNSLSWPDELSRFALTWMVFLGTAMVTRRSRQISIDLMTRSLKPRGLAIHAFAIPVVVAAVAAFLLHYGSELVAKASYVTPALQWPIGALYLAVPFGATLSLIFFVLEPVRGLSAAWSGFAAAALGVVLYVFMLSAPGLTII